MSDKLPAGCLSKPDALEKYQKPERTFQRRLAKALLTADGEFLSHLFLETSDGVVRNGTDVGEGEVDRLKGKGLYPVWHIDEEWFAQSYDEKTRSKSGDKKSQPTVAASPSEPFIDRSTLDRQALVAEIESLRRELQGEKGHNELITGQLAIKDEQIQAANKIAIESNQREKEYSSLLKELTGVMRAQIEQGSRTDTGGEKHDSSIARVTNETQKADTKEDVIEVVTHTKAAAKTKGDSRPKTKKPNSARRKPTKTKAQKTRWYNTPISELLSRR